MSGIFAGLAFVLALGTTMFGSFHPVHADDYPGGTITTVVALGLGGSVDVITRRYGQKLL
jgi:tripartite-type tricarboxylate transporter receptor subunit TctC